MSRIQELVKCARAGTFDADVLKQTEVIKDWVKAVFSIEVASEINVAYKVVRGIPYYLIVVDIGESSAYFRASIHGGLLALDGNLALNGGFYDAHKPDPMLTLVFRRAFATDQRTANDIKLAKSIARLEERRNVQEVTEKGNLL